MYANITGMSVSLTRRLLAFLCVLALAVAPAGASHAAGSPKAQTSVSGQVMSGHGAVPAADAGQADADQIGGMCAQTHDCLGGCDCVAPCGSAFLPAVAGWKAFPVRSAYGTGPTTSGNAARTTHKKPPRTLHSV